MFSRVRARITVANVAVTGALILGLTGWAVAASTGTNAVVHGCYQKHGGTLHIVGAHTKCSRSERAISWNEKGPQGASGAAGAAGAQGAKGDQGTPGPTASGYAQNQNLNSSTTGGSYTTAVALSGTGGSGQLTVGFNARLQIHGIVSVVMSNTAQNGDVLETSCKPQVAPSGSGFSDAGPSSSVRLIEGVDQAGNVGGTVAVVGELDVAPGTYDARIVCRSNGGGVSNGATTNNITGDAIGATAVAK